MRGGENCVTRMEILKQHFQYSVEEDKSFLELRIAKDPDSCVWPSPGVSLYYFLPCLPGSPLLKFQLQHLCTNLFMPHHLAYPAGACSLPFFPVFSNPLHSGPLTQASNDLHSSQQWWSLAHMDEFTSSCLDIFLLSFYAFHQFDCGHAGALDTRT